MDVKNTSFSSIEQVTGQYFGQKKQDVNNTGRMESFEKILSGKIEDSSAASGLKFSKHASQRLADRNIDLSEEQMSRLEKGAKISSEKGIRESLVLMDSYAFIVNTKNNIVVTAIEQSTESENVYTNIDGTVLV